MHNKILLVLILFSLFIGAGTLRRGHEWGDDFASYIMQAQSILNGNTGEFIERNTFTIFESSLQIGPVAYPWGYPLILTPALLLKGIHPLTLKIPGLFFFAGFLICLFLLTRNRLTRTESLLLVSLFAFNPTLVKFLDQILSDIPFLFFSTLALLLMSSPRQRDMRGAVWLGVVIFFAFFIRTTGIILLASFLIHQLLLFYREPEQRKHIGANSLIVMLVFAILWFVLSLLFPSGQSSYLKQLGGFTSATFAGNTSGYFAMIGFFFGNSALWNYIYSVLTVFFLIGGWTRRGSDRPFIIFFAAYFLFISIWPEWQGTRFIFPLLPIFIYFTFQGMKAVINKLPEEYRLAGERLHYGFWILIAGMFLFTSTANVVYNLRNGRSINGPFDPYSMEVYDYVREKTPSDSIIVFFKPRVMVMMTDHNTIMSMECDRILSGDYLVLSRKVGENQQIPPEEINACNLPLDKVLDNRRFIIYRVLK